MAPQVANSSPVHHQHTTPSIAQTMVPSLHRLHRLGAFLISMPCRTLRAFATAPPRARPNVSSNTHPGIQIIYMPEPPAAAQAAGTPERVISLDRIPCTVCASSISKQLRAPTALADMMPCLSRHPRITKTWSAEWELQAEHGLRLNDLHRIAAQPRASPIAFARLAAIGHVEDRLQQAWHKLVRGRSNRPCPHPRVSPNPAPCERILKSQK
jgi:hypothetical protein